MGRRRVAAWLFADLDLRGVSWADVDDAGDRRESRSVVWAVRRGREGAAGNPVSCSLPTAVPTDPLIYRFYELVMVYGTTWKERIKKEFGDGIMSAIDFDMGFERQRDQKGDRVKISISGKFLPYKRY